MQLVCPKHLIFYPEFLMQTLLLQDQSMNNHLQVFYLMHLQHKFLIKGKGGHAALPHMSKDTITIGSQIILALQTIEIGRASCRERV